MEVVVGGVNVGEHQYALRVRPAGGRRVELHGATLLPGNDPDLGKLRLVLASRAGKTKVTSGREDQDRDGRPSTLGTGFSFHAIAS
jgi:hypothetical protein